MEEVGSITFSDRDSGDEAWLGVRAAPGLVALAVSLKEDGDYDVVFTPEECRQIAAILEKAARAAS